MKRRNVASLFVAVMLALAPVSAQAACCAMNGGPCNIIPPLKHGIFPWTGAVCGTTISGTSCTVELDANVTDSSAGNCLTLGSGVALDLKGYSLTCTDSSCGDAITNTASGSGTSAVSITNGSIIGCWTSGISVSGGTNSSVSDLTIDKVGGCSGGSYGLFYIAGTIDHVVVKNAADRAVWLTSGKQIKNSIIRDNGIGIWTSYNSTSNSLDNVLMYNNDVHFQNATPEYQPSVQRSEFVGATTCNCKNNTVCDADTACFDFMNNTTTPSMMDDAIVP